MVISGETYPGYIGKRPPRRRTQLICLLPLKACLCFQLHSHTLCSERPPPSQNNCRETLELWKRGGGVERGDIFTYSVINDLLIISISCYSWNVLFGSLTSFIGKHISWPLGPKYAQSCEFSFARFEIGRSPDVICNKKQMHVNFFATFVASLNDANLSFFSLSYNIWWNL